MSSPNLPASKSIVNTTLVTHAKEPPSVPNKTKPFKWTINKHKAVGLLIEGRLNRRQIAEQCRTSESSLNVWNDYPEFQAALRQTAAKFQEQVITEGIANKHVRLRALNRLHYKHEDVLEQRAEDPRMQTTIDVDGLVLPLVPGGKTGTIIIQQKLAGYDSEGNPIFRDEAVYDAAFVREYRATLKQAAEEMGDLVTRTELTGKDGKPLAVTVGVMDDLAARVAAAKERSQRELTDGDNDTE